MSGRRMVGVTIVTALVLVALVIGGGVREGDDAPLASPSSDATGSSASGPSDNGVTDGEGTEVIRQPDASATEGLPGLSAADPPRRGALVTGSKPRTASRRGAVVTGFPVEVIPVLSGSVVRSSGVSSTSRVLQVSIVADSSRSAGSVLAFYRTKLSAHGFEEAPAPATGGSTASTFRRGRDNLVVTTTAGARTTRYSLFGTLRTGA